MAFKSHPISHVNSWNFNETPKTYEAQDWVLGRRHRGGRNSEISKVLWVHNLVGKTEYKQLNIFSSNADNRLPLHSCETSDFCADHIFITKRDQRTGAASGSTRPAESIFRKEKQELCDKEREEEE